MEDHRKRIGQKIVELREHAGLSQLELAQRAGVVEKTISRAENGRVDVRGGTLRSIAKALDVEIDELLGVAPQPLGLENTPAEVAILARLDDLEVKLDQVLALLAATPAEAPKVPPLPGRTGKRVRDQLPTAEDPAPPQKRRRRQAS
jgi:transcriptional regulator with XRE-family HTH domain